MRKSITAMIIAAGLILTGCGIRLGSSQTDKDPFDSDFDERGYFTKSANTNSPEVYIVIWSAPWEQDTANGLNYHTWTEMYGYTMGFYQE